MDTGSWFILLIKRLSKVELYLSIEILLMGSLSAKLSRGTSQGKYQCMHFRIQAIRIEGITIGIC
jgi:hypothetical protein